MTLVVGRCNASGTLEQTIKRVEAEAYAKWEFNHTNRWIDVLFQTHYQAYGTLYRALAPSLPQLVAAEEGLGRDELQQMQGEAEPH